MTVGGTPAARLLTWLIVAAVAVSAIHYADNVFNYEDFPQGGSLPEPTAEQIGVTWLVLTPVGLLGLALFRRGRVRSAAIALAVYSVSGLVGIGHYTVPGALDMPWWRHAHVVADILLGAAVLAFALWTVRRSGGEPDEPAR